MAEEEYRPSRETILLRGLTLRWMQDRGWEEELIESIMHDDHPSVELVSKMLERFGAGVTYNRIRRFWK